MVIILNRKKITNTIFLLALILGTGLSFGMSSGSEPASAPPITNKTILIDPGHGTPDGGATGVGGSIEKDINLQVAKQVGEMLAKWGARVVYTREDDYTVADTNDKNIKDIKNEDLKIRKQMIEDSKADIFISIHMNKFDDQKYFGAQVFYDGYTDQSKQLAQHIQQSLIDFADTQNKRLAKHTGGSVYILRNVNIPSVLIECGFLSNKKEETLLQNPEYQNKLAFAICAGITDYLSE